MVHAPPASRDRLEISRAPGLPSVELHAGTAFAHSYPGHWHDEFFVTAITDGEGVFGYRGKEHRAARGTMFFVVPGEVHSHGSGRGGRSFRSLHAGNPLVSSLAPELSRMAGPAGLRSFAITDASLLGEFLFLHRLLEKDGSVLRKESRLLAFFVKLVGGTPDALPPATVSGPERAAVRRARRFLDESCSSPVSLRELASLAGLSPFHFHRLFRSQVGIPPHEYHVRRRLLRARALLGEGEPAAHVAAATGFADQSHLTRHFKRLLGVAPADYARRSKKSRKSKNVQDALDRPL